jgi:hypothetical protein
MCSRHTSFTMLLAAPSVVLADAGTHTSWQGWIPAYAGMTDEKQGLDSRLRGNDETRRE